MSQPHKATQIKLIAAGVIFLLAAVILAWQLWPTSETAVTDAEAQQQAIMEQVGKQPPPPEEPAAPAEPDNYGRRARPVK